MLEYKKLIKDRDTRIRIMQAFNWVPDKIMLSIQYRMKTGRKVNWKNPTRFTEKLQLYKIATKDNELMAKCADKGDVRSFVENRGLEDILIPIVGIYTSPEQIEWNSLPERFVIKDTLGSGGNSVIVCTDKAKLNHNEILKHCSKWMNCKYKHAGREHVYDKQKHRIIIEEYLDTANEPEGMVDYKFICFDGKPEYIYAISNRELGNGAEIGIYDMDFNLLPYERADERPPSHAVRRPRSFDRMVEISKILSDGFPEVRIDLFNINGRVYFGEMTFFDGSGYMTFKPDEFDTILGHSFQIHL